MSEPTNPMATAPRDGTPIIVKNGPKYAKVYWRPWPGGDGGSWCLKGTCEALDFTPRTWCDLEAA